MTNQYFCHWQLRFLCGVYCMCKPSHSAWSGLLLINYFLQQRQSTMHSCLSFSSPFFRLLVILRQCQLHSQAFELIHTNELCNELCKVIHMRELMCWQWSVEAVLMNIMVHVTMRSPVTFQHWSINRITPSMMKRSIQFFMVLWRGQCSLTTISLASSCDRHI